MDHSNIACVVNTTPQSVYDAFNTFIFSADLRVLPKLLARHNLMKMVLDVPGDIVEVGVFKGSGMASWLKMKKIMLPAVSAKKVIGFDFFDTDSLVASLHGNDRDRMAALFTDRGFRHTEGTKEWVQSLLVGAGFVDQIDFELVSGDVMTTVQDYVDERPGFRCSLLYIDVDIDEPTMKSLEAIWPRLPTGAIVAFDEYGVNEWSEANAVDRFLAPRGLRLQSIDVPYPTAYVRKV